MLDNQKTLKNTCEKCKSNNIKTLKYFNINKIIIISIVSGFLSFVCWLIFLKNIFAFYSAYGFFINYFEQKYINQYFYYCKDCNYISHETYTSHKLNIFYKIMILTTIPLGVFIYWFIYK